MRTMRSSVLTVTSLTRLQAFPASDLLRVLGEHGKVGEGLVFAPVSGIFCSSVISTCTKCSIGTSMHQLFYLKDGQREHAPPSVFFYLKDGQGEHAPPTVVVTFGLTTEK